MNKHNNKTKEDKLYIAKKKKGVRELARIQVEQGMKEKLDELFVEELNNKGLNK